MIKLEGYNVFSFKKEIKGWSICKLEKAVNIVGGSQPPKKVFKTESENGHVRLIQIRDYKSDRFLTYIPENSTKKFCDENDIMIGRYGPPVFQILRGLKGAYNVALMKAIPLRNMDSDFLFHLLSSPPIQNLVIGNSKRTSGQTGVNLKLLDSCLIPLPPLEEQKRIAAILDAADEVRQKNKALIEKYNQLTQSLFLDMFGDPVANPKMFEFPKLEEVCKVSQGMQIAITKRFKEDGINRFKYLTVAFINGRKDAEFIENPRVSVVCTNDEVLMTRTGNTGQVVTGVNGVFHNNFFKVDWKREILIKEYFVAFLSHGKIRQELLKKASTTTIPDLNHSQFYNLRIILPSMKLQNQFAERIQSIEAQKFKAQASLKKSEDLFNALLQKAFKGELSV